MPLILNIETATTVCSVSISKNTEILALKELDAGYTHAENLHPFIVEAAKTAGIALQQLDAVSVSCGPGSYTGLRIGVSTAKGIAYALKVPLISIDTLQLMSFGVMLKNPGFSYYCPMIDARRMEIYCSLFDNVLNIVSPVQALIADEKSIEAIMPGKKTCYFGNGMDKCRHLLERSQFSEFTVDIKPSARFMANLAMSKYLKNEFEDIAYFEPFYLKDFLIVKKKN